MSPFRNESWGRSIVAGLLAAKPSRPSLSPRLPASQKCYCSSAPPPKQPSCKKAPGPESSLKGQSGRIYTIEKVLQEKEFPSPGCVYLATAEDQHFVLKNVSEASFVDYQEMYQRLRSCPHLRVACDSVPDRSTFVYEYSSDHLPESSPGEPRALLGGGEAYPEGRAARPRRVTRTRHYIKPNNILIHRRHDNAQGTQSIDHVQLADLEAAAHVPPGRDIVGKQAGNWMWRSPEAHASGRVDKPSDMFSFGIVCIYPVHKRAIFAVGEHELGDGEHVLAHVLERQISYFADEEGLAALSAHLGADGNPWVEVFGILRDGFGAENPREPFSLWEGVDEGLKDLVGRLTNFDPAGRLTAREALRHPWFCSG